MKARLPSASRTQAAGPLKDTSSRSALSLNVRFPLSGRLECLLSTLGRFGSAFRVVPPEKLQNLVV
jgi:hypothetical protein